MGKSRKQASAESGKRLTIMVSSSVYGIEELLDRIYTMLTQFGYEVWMSRAGTIQVFSDRPAFASCLDAVEKCDLFLGLITPSYGSGKDADGPSITHQELLKAIELNKPRWLLAHDHVVFARALLNNLGFEGKAGRKAISIKKKNSRIMDDLRVIDMYEDATISHKPLGEREGNWVQSFESDDDAMRFAIAQFSRYQEVEEFVRENLQDRESVAREVARTRDVP